jgi:hypothetical protein
VVLISFLLDLKSIFENGLENEKNMKKNKMNNSPFSFQRGNPPPTCSLLPLILGRRAK